MTRRLRWRSATGRSAPALLLAAAVTVWAVAAAVAVVRAVLEAEPTDPWPEPC